MARIRSTTSPSGTSPYTFPRNPSEYESQDSFYAESIPILHGAAVWQRKAWDDRPRVLRWFAVGATSTVEGTAGAPMNAAIRTMRNWVGTVRYFDFSDIARINENWPSVTQWNKARVIDLKLVPRRGGELRYDSIELTLQPEK